MIDAPNMPESVFEERCPTKVAVEKWNLRRTAPNLVHLVWTSTHRAPRPPIQVHCGRYLTPHLREEPTLPHSDFRLVEEASLTVTVTV